MPSDEAHRTAADRPESVAAPIRASSIPTALRSYGAQASVAIRTQGNKKYQTDINTFVEVGPRGPA